MTEKNQPYSFLNNFKRLLNIKENLIGNEYNIDKCLTGNQEVKVITQFVESLNKIAFFSNKEKDFFDESVIAVKKANQKKISGIQFFLLFFGSLFLLIMFSIALPTPIEKEDYVKVNLSKLLYQDVGKRNYEQISNENNTNEEKIINLAKLYNQKAHLIYKDFILNKLQVQYKDDVNVSKEEGKKYSFFGRLQSNFKYLKALHASQIHKHIIPGNIESKRPSYKILENNITKENQTAVIVDAILFLLFIFSWAFLPKYFSIKGKNGKVFGKTIHLIFELFKKKMLETGIIEKIQRLFYLEKNINMFLQGQLNLNDNCFHQQGAKMNQNLNKTLTSYQKEIKTIKQFFEDNNIVGDIFEILKMVSQNYDDIKIHEVYVLGQNPKKDNAGLISQITGVYSLIIGAIFYLLTSLLPYSHDNLLLDYINGNIELKLETNDLIINENNRPYLNYMIKNAWYNSEQKEKRLVEELRTDISRILKLTPFEKENEAFKNIKEITPINEQIEQIISELQPNVK